MYGSRFRIVGALLACLVILPLGAAWADKNVKIEYETFQDGDGDWCVVKDSVNVDDKQVKVGNLKQSVNWKTKKVGGAQYPKAGGQWLIETKAKKEFVLCPDKIGPFTQQGNEYSGECELVAGVMPQYVYRVSWSHNDCEDDAVEDPEIIFKDGAGLLPNPFAVSFLLLSGLLAATTFVYWNRYRKLKP